jgi:phosphoglycerol transferase MdoB-like AlkP superfamily enzyme
LKKNNTILFITVCYILTNLFVFSLSRFFFLESFAAEHASKNITNVLIGGFYLDLSLISCELLLVTIIHFILRKLNPRPLLLTLWSLTGIHLVFNVANHLFFAERNQHVAEMLLAHITSPYQAWIATYPFIAAHPALFAFMLGITLVFFYSGYRQSRKLQINDDVINTKHKLMGALVIALFFLTASFSYITVKKNRDASGEQLKFIRSSHFTHFNSFILNQAVINPIHELLFFQLPVAMKSTMPFVLTPKEAYRTSMKVLNINKSDPEWPLLRPVKKAPNSEFSNVVTVEIEGLTASIFEHEQDGQKVMPYLNKLASNGVYFANTMQSFNATAGSFFSTVTGFHKISFDEKTKRFTTAELNAYYGSLPHILGSKNYNHYYFGGFRQSALDFLRFMGNQGYQTYGYEKLSQRLDDKGTLEQADSTLGLFDKDFLKESAIILNAVATNYTAHLMTATSHSPWTIPEDAESSFNEPALNAFGYVDQSIKAFMQVLEQNPTRFKDTLFVFVADHTSYTFNDDLLEKIRIPLIFYTPTKRLELTSDTENKIASHVDIIPSILTFLKGEHQHSGMGKNLFSNAEQSSSALSGSRYNGIYIKDDLIFQYLPYEEKNKLMTIKNITRPDSLTPQEMAQIQAQMKQEYLAQYELSKRLSIEKKIFPQ